MTSMEQVFNLFDRFVTAHEQLAKAVALAQLPPAPPRPQELITKAMPAEAPDPLPEAVEAATQTPPEGKPDRAFLKAELDRLGVTYTSKTATTTLLKRYKEALAEAQQPAGNSEPPAVTPPPPNPPADKLWKIEEVRERLHAFVGRYGEAGRTAAREKLNTLNAVNLSALDPAHFPEMIAFINNYAARG